MKQSIVVSTPGFDVDPINHEGVLKYRLTVGQTSVVIDKQPTHYDVEAVPYEKEIDGELMICEQWWAYPMDKDVLLGAMPFALPAQFEIRSPQPSGKVKLPAPEFLDQWVSVERAAVLVDEYLDQIRTQLGAAFLEKKGKMADFLTSVQSGIQKFQNTLQQQFANPTGDLVNQLANVGSQKGGTGKAKSTGPSIRQQVTDLLTSGTKMSLHMLRTKTGCTTTQINGVLNAPDMKEKIKREESEHGFNLYWIDHGVTVNQEHLIETRV